jgi:hypothetical protein
LATSPFWIDDRDRMSGQNELDVSGPGIPRRRALRVAAAAALATVVWSPSASAEPVGRIDNDEALEGALPASSNWGRWGEDDQLGTLNFIIPQTRLAAAALIRTGRVVPIGRTPYRRRQAATTSSA